MELEKMYLTDELAEKLFAKLDEYNSKNPEKEITAQQLSKKLLDYAIRYVKIESID